MRTYEVTMTLAVGWGHVEKGKDGLRGVTQ